MTIPDGWVAQQYLPTEQADKRYYEPTRPRRRAEVRERMDSATRTEPNDRR